LKILFGRKFLEPMEINNNAQETVFDVK